MAMPQELTNPHAQNPASVAGPVPTDASGAQALASAPAGAKMGAQGPQGGGGAPAKQASANPFDEALSDENKKGFEKQKAGDASPFDEKDANFPTGYKPVTPRLRQNPAGNLEVLRHSGKWEAMSETEASVMGQFAETASKWGLRAKEDLPRFLGAIFGGVIGEMSPVPGGGIAGAGLGQAAAGAAANYMQGKENTAGSAGTDVISGAGAAMLPLGVGKFLEGQAARFAGESAMGPAIRAGAEVMTQQAQARLDAAGQLGMNLRPDQINPGNVGINQQVQKIMQGGGKEAQKLAQVQAAQKQILLENRDQLISKLKGPYESEIGGENPNFSDVFGTVLRNHENAIASIKSKAFEASGNQVYDVDPVLAVMREKISDKLKRNIFSDQGRVDKNLLSDTRDFYGGLPEASKKMVGDYLRLQNASMTGRGVNEPGAFKNASPMEMELKQASGTIDPTMDTALKLKPGLKLAEMDVFRKGFGDEANFNKAGPRDEVERAYGDIYYAMRTHLDGKMTDVLQKEHPTDAAKLMAHKDFYSHFKEDAADFQKKVEHDPSNAASSLIDGKDPAGVKSLVALLDDKQRKYLAGGYLENLSLPMLDAASGKMRVTPMETGWRKTDPKVKKMLFGEDEKTIDSLITVSKAIESKDLTLYDPTVDPLTQRASGMVQSLKNTRSAISMIMDLFKKNPKARDYIAGQAADVLMPTGKDAASLANKQRIMENMSRVSLSKPMRGAAALLGADIGTPHEDQNAIPSRAAP